MIRAGVPVSLWRVGAWDANGSNLDMLLYDNGTIGIIEYGFIAPTKAGGLMDAPLTKKVFLWRVDSLPHNPLIHITYTFLGPRCNLVQLGAIIDSNQTAGTDKSADCCRYCISHVSVQPSSFF